MKPVLALLIVGALGYFNDRLVMKMTVATHDRKTIVDSLQAAYSLLFPHGVLASTHDVIKRMDNQRQCLENTSVKYYLRSMKPATRQIQASECRLNLSRKFKAVLVPSFSVHETLSMHSETKDLETRVIDIVQHDPQLHLSFYHFDDLNYNLQCYLEHHEVGQVKLLLRVVETTLEKVVHVPPACGFTHVQPLFDGQYAEPVVFDIPMNGTFVCDFRRSDVCNAQSAETSNAHYKLGDD